MTTETKDSDVRLDRLNAIDPDGGWGRLKIGSVEFVAVKGTSEIPGSQWL